METRLTILLNLAFLQFSEEVGMNDCYQFGHFVRQIVTKVKFWFNWKITYVISLFY